MLLWAGRALHYRTVINSYVAKDLQLRKLELNEEDWHGLELVEQWLLAFREATTEMSATHKPMLSSLYSVFRGLQSHLREKLSALPDNTNGALVNAIIDSHDVLGKYFYKSKSSPYYAWAACVFDCL